METKELQRGVLNSRYAAAIDHLIKTFILKNNREFAARMEESPTILSSIKSGHRNASLAQIYNLINEFNLNANFFLKSDNSQEQVEYKGSGIYANVTGKNKDVTIGKTVSKIAGEVGSYYNHVEKLVNDANPELKDHIKMVHDKCEGLEKEKLAMKDELVELKKIIGSMTDQIQEAQVQIKEKDERLYQAQCELIEVYKQQKN
jgi:hypothetical protein